MKKKNPVVEVAAEAASQDVTDRIFDETKPQPEAAKTDVTPETNPEAIPSPIAAAQENLAKMVEEASTQRLPGVIGEVEEITFRTIARSLEELPIDSIQHFNLIPDFVNPTAADHPIIVRTDEGNFCIEGWSLVQSARSEGKSTIQCEVDELDTHSDEEICLRKGGIRSLTRGGICTYPEMMRNARDLLAMLLSSDDDLKIYGHGQRRYGEGFVNNREKDVRYVLTIRLGRDRDTINKYLTHCEYLSNEAIKTFIDRKAPKDFFEKTEGKKQIELKNQKGINLSTGRKTKAISKFMLDEFEKYPKGKRSGQAPTQGPAGSNTADQPESAQSDAPANNNDSKGGDEYPTTGSDMPTVTCPDNPEEPTTLDAIKSRALDVSKRFTEDLSKDITLAEMKRRLQEELIAINSLLAGIDSLSSKEKEQK